MKGVRGFTLIEVMVSMMIMSMLSLILFYAFAGIARSRELIDENADIQTMGRIAMTRLEREFSLSFLSAVKSPTGTFETRFFAEDSDPVDTVSFTSLSHERMVRDAKESDQTEIGLWQEPDRESRYHMLMHREAARIDDDNESGGVVLPLAHNVKRLNLRFFDVDKRKWYDDWDSDSVDHANKLPFMVDIELVLSDEAGVEYPFRSRVFTHHHTPLGKDHTPAGGATPPGRP